MASAIWVAVAILLMTVLWALATAIRAGIDPLRLVETVPATPFTGWLPVDRVLAYLIGFALTLPIVGSVDVLPRAAHELPPPRVQALKRTALVNVLFILIVGSLGTLLVSLLIPVTEQSLWTNAPLAGLAQHLMGPAVIRGLMAIAVACAAGLMLVPATHAALRRRGADAAPLLVRRHAALRSRIAAQSVRNSRSCGGRDRRGDGRDDDDQRGPGVVVSRGYAVAIAGVITLAAASLMRLRRVRATRLLTEAPINVRMGKRELSVGLILTVAAVIATATTMILTGDIATISATGLLVALSLWFSAGASDESSAVDSESEESTFDLLISTELSPASRRGAARERAGAGPQPAPAGACRCRAPDARRSRHRRDDGAASRH